MVDSKKMLLCLAVVGLLMAPMAAAGGFEDYEALDKAWEEAYNRGDSAAVSEFYTNHGTRMPPNAPAVDGREAIQAQIQAGMDAGAPKVRIELTEHAIAGDMAYARGIYEIMDAEGNVVDKGKWLNVGNRKDNGRWHILRDIWNSDMPLPE